MSPSLFRNELLATEWVPAQVRSAGPDDKVKRLGHHPVIVPVAAQGVRMEIATAAQNRDRAVRGALSPLA